MEKYVIINLTKRKKNRSDSQRVATDWIIAAKWQPQPRTSQLQNSNQQHAFYKGCRDDDDGHNELLLGHIFG
jgi:hypothetical protein